MNMVYSAAFPHKIKSLSQAAENHAPTRPNIRAALMKIRRDSSRQNTPDFNP
jgi:hypothetical protein